MLLPLRPRPLERVDARDEGEGEAGDEGDGGSACDGDGEELAEVFESEVDGVTGAKDVVATDS